MRNGTFLQFIWPSLIAMVLFIALPIASVFVQSLHVEHEQVLIVTENCGPFGCTEATAIDHEATRQLREEQPLGQYSGFETYKNRSHLAFERVAAHWRNADSLADFGSRVMNLPFYRALAFTITYTAVVTPLVILFGLAIALGINALPKLVKGPTIFFTLLPMIVTPLIGSLILFWMIDSRGIIGETLVQISGDPNLSLKGSTVLTWITLMVYGVWHNAPFAFIVFYAGLQTVPEETLEASIVDGASRWERVRYIVVPHMMPLVVFVSLMQLMDNFRVFEPVVGFSAEAHATTLSWLIYNDLFEGDVPLYSSAATTSMITILGVAVLVTPVLIRTWRDFNRRAAK